MFAVASVALATATFLWIVRPPAERLELAPQPRSASTDHDIFDVVLLDLIQNQDFDPAVGGRGVAKSEIVFGDTTSGFARVEGGLDFWIREKGVSSEIRDNLIARNPRGTRYLLTRYHPSDPSILVRNLSQIDQDLDFSSQFPNARGYVAARLPGYSRDGLTALVYFSFGPTAHGARGYYLLKKVRGRWEIIERSIGYFG
jgi:hypothetical protein